jgi:hypothetical protein
MKHSNIWFALILIASASLLSAASSASGESPRPTPKPVPLASKIEEQTANDQSRTQKSPSVLNDQQSADKSQNPASADSAADNYERVNTEAAIAQAVFAFFVMVFTCVLSVIAVQQFSGYRNLERGAIIVDEIELRDFLPESKLKPPDASTYIVFRFRNVGRTPLRLVESKVQFHLATELVEPPDYGDHPLNMKGTILPQNEKLFRMYRLYDPKLPRARLPDVTYDLITNTNDVFLVLYGYIRYIDAFGKRHITGFGYQYSALASIYSKRSEFQVYGSDAYNYTKKDGR